ncbi:hypothetical protein BHM03_00004342 [Ensete ventricosum]|nr:hypothetical protein BHM03_00004342 [Ensete ventricosum]
MVPQRRVFCVRASNLASDESLGYQHMGVIYHRARILNVSTRESHRGDLIIQRGVEAGGRKGEEVATSPEGLNYPKAKRRLERRWTQRSTTVPQRQIYRLRRKGRRYKATDRRAIGWQRHGTIEAGLPWSHQSLALMEGERQS